MDHETSLIPAPSKPVYVYEYKAWAGYLFPSICASATNIEAGVRQSNTRILKKISSNGGYFLFHINLTKTELFFRDREALIQALQTKGVVPLNGGVFDTSKRYLQKVCAASGLNTTRAMDTGEESELLIVKTNFNFGGRQEKRLQRSDFRRLAIGSKEYSTDIMYPVVQRKEVGKEIWNNESLMVEKFIANKNDFVYRVYKLLNRIVITEVIERGFIKKMITAEQRLNFYYELMDNEVLPGSDSRFLDLLASITNLCHAMKLDFAAIDVVRSDEDKFYIIDVNVTPNWNRTDQSEKLAFLAAGLSR